MTHVTVNRTLARLKQAGYVNTRPYRSIFLTGAGDGWLRNANDAMKLSWPFLRSLGISETIAELDAEGIEHHVSPETLAAFERWLNEA